MTQPRAPPTPSIKDHPAPRTISSTRIYQDRHTTHSPPNPRMPNTASITKPARPVPRPAQRSAAQRPPISRISLSVGKNCLAPESPSPDSDELLYLRNPFFTTLISTQPPLASSLPSSTQTISMTTHLYPTPIHNGTMMTPSDSLSHSTRSHYPAAEPNSLALTSQHVTIDGSTQ
jgi:hypothetical protein